MIDNSGESTDKISWLTKDLCISFVHRVIARWNEVTDVMSNDVVLTDAGAGHLLGHVSTGHQQSLREFRDKHRVLYCSQLRSDALVTVINCHSAAPYPVDHDHCSRRPAEVLRQGLWWCLYPVDLHDALRSLLRSSGKVCDGVSTVLIFMTHCSPCWGPPARSVTVCLPCRSSWRTAPDCWGPPTTSARNALSARRSLRCVTSRHTTSTGSTTSAVLEMRSYRLSTSSSSSSSQSSLDWTWEQAFSKAIYLNALCKFGLIFFCSDSLGF